MAKWILRRSGVEEKILTIVKHRQGHECATAWIVVAVVAWEGVPSHEADRIYSLLTHKLNRFGLPTTRRCGTNEPRTCACQGLDPDSCGASFSFGCSWSMYYNGCKYARSKTVRKFRLSVKSEEQEVEERMHVLATLLSPLYLSLAPEAFNNQTQFEREASDCRLGFKPGRPFSGVTACIDFCAHSHRDLHNMNNGCTIVVSLTKHRSLSKPEDEQLHVLPLYIMDETDEFGSKEGQEEKIRAGAVDVLTKYPCEVRVRSVPLQPCRRHGKKRKEEEPETVQKKEIFKNFPEHQRREPQMNTEFISMENSRVMDAQLQSSHVSSTVLDSPVSMYQGWGYQNDQQWNRNWIDQRKNWLNPWNDYHFGGLEREMKVVPDSTSLDDNRPRSQNTESEYRTPPRTVNSTPESQVPSPRNHPPRGGTPASFSSSGYYSNPLSNSSSHSNSSLPNELYSPKSVNTPTYSDARTRVDYQNPYDQRTGKSTEVFRQFEGTPTEFLPKERNPNNSNEGLSTPRDYQQNQYLPSIYQVPQHSELPIEATKTIDLHHPFADPHTWPDRRQNTPSENPNWHKLPEASPFRVPKGRPPSRTTPTVDPNMFPNPFVKTFLKPQEPRHPTRGENSWLSWPQEQEINHPMPGLRPFPHYYPVFEKTYPNYEGYNYHHQYHHQAEYPTQIYQQKRENYHPSYQVAQGVPPTYHHHQGLNPSWRWEKPQWEIYGPPSYFPVLPEPPPKAEPLGEVADFSDNEECFKDAQMGGVAIALGHGSVLFECAKHEMHCTTALKKPNRLSPTRISLVFYQHRNLNRGKHGWEEWEEKMRLRKLGITSASGTTTTTTTTTNVQTSTTVSSPGVSSGADKIPNSESMLRSSTSTTIT